MTREDLRHHLSEMKPGETFSLPYDMIEGMFAPPDEDHAARDACLQLAGSCGSTVAFDDEAQQVRFTRTG